MALYLLSGLVLKQYCEQMIQQALDVLVKDKNAEIEKAIRFNVSRTKDEKHGDFASNVALVASKALGLKPRECAQQLVALFPKDSNVVKVDIAGPGFINLFLSKDNQFDVIKTIHEQKEKFGCSSYGDNKRVLIEYVSANPTGPLHVGHGRGAAYGASLSALLATAGFNVEQEYYVNDAGRQMNILAASVYLRYLELCGEAVVFPTNGYQGDYVWDIAATLHRENDEKYKVEIAQLFDGVHADEPQGGNKELHIDDLIENSKRLLGDDGYLVVFNAGLDTILGDIKDDLGLFGVDMDHWFSEKSLMSSGAIDKAIGQLKASGYIYEKEGALWFKSTEFGDEKDRVAIRDNGQATYFASDIAYHLQKLDRGFDRLIDIWGADHHGYVARVKAAIEAFKQPSEKLEILLVQFAVLYRNKEKVGMSTRSGQFVTLRQLRKDVGRDAARFFYVMRKCEQHMDFDLDLAISQSSDNPVYYIQYAHARICSVLRQLKEKGFEQNLNQGGDNLALLVEQAETDLIKQLLIYPEMIVKAARNEEPHVVTYYLRDLAQAVHGYYNQHHFIVDDEKMRDARLALITATQTVIQNGLKIVGVSAPESM
jgi:arginyl-tRNA synthetase